MGKYYKKPKIKNLKSTELSEKKKLSIPKVYEKIKIDNPIKEQGGVIEMSENSENKLLKDRDYSDLEI